MKLPETISDQKRLVRGEQWKRARYWLKARDNVHNRPWRILIIAGPRPHEEIVCLRELMPQAIITAVDIDRVCATAALDAGANEVLVGDIGELEQQPTGSYGFKHVPPPPLRDKKFDAICLDLSGPASDWLRNVVNAYWLECLEARGVMIVTFCYGRDVLERLDEEWQRKRNKDRKNLVSDVPGQLANMPDNIASRVWYVLRSRCMQLDSCLSYKGNKMPMLSCLAVKKSSVSPPARFLSVLPGDFELAVTAENIGNIYACPAERISELRRQATARKAVHTMTIKKMMENATGGEDGSAEKDDDQRTHDEPDTDADRGEGDVS